MSYCRTGDDSNVYVFGNGKTWEIYVQVSERIDPNGSALDDANWRPFLHPRAGQNFDCKDRQACLDILKQLRAEGLKVPVRAIKRLQKEIRG